MAEPEAAHGHEGEEEDEWVEYFDESYGRPYYFNLRTQETVWVKPGEEEEEEEEEEDEDGEGEAGGAAESGKESGEESGKESGEESGEESAEEEGPHKKFSLNPASAAVIQASLQNPAATPEVIQGMFQPPKPVLSESREVSRESSRRESVETSQSSLAVGGRKLGKTLSEHRTAKHKAAGGPALPSLPSSHRTPGASNPSLPSMPSMPPRNPSALRAPSKPVVQQQKQQENPDGVSSPPSVAKLLEGIKDLSSFTLTLYAKSHFHITKKSLMRKGDSVDKLLSWQGDVLKKPLHDKLPKKTFQEALKLFPYILAYMGDKGNGELDVVKVARYVLDQLIRDKDLRDEVFCQLCKQTTKNPGVDSNFRGWQLMALTCGCVHPTPEFDSYLKQYIAEHVEVEGIGEMAQFALSRLDSTVRVGCRRNVPCNEEIDAVRKQKPIIIRVYFLDNTYKTVAMQASLSCLELTEMVAEKIRLKDSSHFSLFEYNRQIEVRMLKDDEQVLDAMGGWQFQDERAIRKKEMQPSEAGQRFRLVFKPKIVLSTMEDVSDPSCIDLLYAQSVFHVLVGNYSCTPEDVVKMAALQLQAAFGDHNPDNITKGMVADNPGKYVPAQWVNTQSPQEWEAVIFEMHQRLSGRNKMDSKLSYLSYVKKRPLYGASFFHVSRKKPDEDAKEPVILAINQEGIQILKPGITKERISGFPFSEIVSWAFTKQTFTFVTGDLAEQRKFNVDTDRGSEMSAVCQGYVNAVLANM